MISSRGNCGKEGVKRQEAQWIRDRYCSTSCLQGECQNARMPECQNARMPECQNARMPECPNAESKGLSCLANRKLLISQELRSIDRSRANSFFSFLSPGKIWRGLSLIKGDRSTQPSDFMVSALLSLSSYVLGPDMMALDVKSHSASDGESDIILRRISRAAV